MDIFTRLATQRLATAPLLRPALRPTFAPRQLGAQAAGSEAGQPDGNAAFAETEPSSRRTTEGAVQASQAAPAFPLHSPATGAFKSGEGLALSERRSASPRFTSGSMPERVEPPPARLPLERAGYSISRDGVAWQRPLSREILRTPPITADWASPTTSPLLAAVGSRAQGTALAGVGSPLPQPPVQVLSHSPRAQAHAPAPPVVHLHIDRIEVRAPAAPVRPTSPRAPEHRAPESSLADYLRRGSRG